MRRWAMKPGITKARAHHLQRNILKVIKPTFWDAVQFDRHCVTIHHFHMESHSVRVLVAHSDPQQRLRLSELFSRWGYEFQQAAHGIDTVVIAQAWEPHVIVAAHSLGNMLITEVADRLERSTIHHAIVVLGPGSRTDEEHSSSRFYACLRDFADTDRLHEIVERAAAEILLSRRTAEPKQQAFDNGGEVLFEVRYGMTAATVERLLIEHTLRRLPNKTHAAQLLGVSLKTLHNKLAEYRAERRS